MFEEKVELSNVENLANLIESLKAVNYPHNGHDKLDSLVKRIIDEVEPQGLTENLLQDVIIFYDLEREEGENKYQKLNALIARAGDVRINYEDILHNEHFAKKVSIPSLDYAQIHKIRWLIDKTDRISSVEHSKLLMESLLYDVDKDCDGSDIKKVIEKSPIFDLTPFLPKAHHPKVASLLLGTIGEITDPSMAWDLLENAIIGDSDELFSEVERKSPSIKLDYDAAFQLAMKCMSRTNYTYHKPASHDRNIRKMLDKGVDPNAAIKINGKKRMPLVAAIYCTEDTTKSLMLDIFLEYGAKLSLIDSDDPSFPDQESIVNLLQKYGKYQQLEDYLNESEAKKPKTAQQLLKCAFSNDDTRLLQILITSGKIDVNAKYSTSDINSHNLHDGDVETLLVMAFRFRQEKITEFLAKSKSDVGDYPIIANVIIGGSNSVLSSLCENGYDYSKATQKSEKSDQNYYSEIHPLRIAIKTKNIQAATILLDYMSASEVKDVGVELLFDAISSYEDGRTDIESLSLLLIKKGVEIPKESRTQVFNSACHSGSVNLVKYFVDNGFDCYKKGDGPSSPLYIACDKKNNELAEYLLQQPVIVGGQLLSSTISFKLLRSDLIAKMVEKTDDLNYYDDYSENALHKTAQSGDKAIYDLLIAKGLDPALQDNSGNDAYDHALYHGNNKKLGIPENYFPFSLDTFDDILSYVKQLDKNYSDTKQGEYAAKLSYLFDDKEQAQSYVEKHKGESLQPLHDLTIFTPPKGIWNKDAWRSLALDNGPKLTKYLSLAEKIETKLGRPPENMDEVESLAKAMKYNRADEFPAMANLIHENVISERTFDRILDSYREKTDDHIPDIFIDGSDIGHDRFYMKKLAKSDLRGFILGNKTNCCQYVGAEGTDCAEHGMNSPFGGFYVTFKREKEGKYNNLKSWLGNLEKSESEQDFLKTFSIKDVRRKYAGIIDSMKKDFKEFPGYDFEFSAIKESLRDTFHKELDGEIVAQSWVWLSEDNNLVMDSWERLRPEDDDLFKPFVKKLSEEILSRNNNISKVMIGKGGYTPGDAGLHAVENPEVPKDYRLYRDSVDQYLVARRDKDLIRTNPALEISNERIFELEDNFSETYLYEDEEGKSSEKPNPYLEILKDVQKLWKNPASKDR